MLSAEPRVLADPAPDIVVSELADSSVNFSVRPWVKTTDYFVVKFAITEAVKLAFDDNFPRLQRLKDRYDPNNLFRRNQNIPPSA